MKRRTPRIIHQKKPFPWACLVTSVAMAHDVDVFDLMEDIGHDGSEIAFGHLPDPACRRGFHIQECIRPLILGGDRVTEIQYIPVIASSPQAGWPTEHINVDFNRRGWQPTDPPFSQNAEDFARLVDETTGFMSCKTITGRSHAVAYSNGWIFDPDRNAGEEYEFDFIECASKGLFPQSAFLVDIIL